MTLRTSGAASSAIGQGGHQIETEQAHSASSQGAASQANHQSSLPRRASFKLDGITAFRSATTAKGAVVAENSIGKAPSAETDADAKLCYPNISSCLTVTGLTRDGSLRGGHVTTVRGLNKETLDTLSTKIGADECTKFVVAGPIDNIKKRTTDTEVDSRKKITSLLQQKSPGAEVRYLDTTQRAAPYAIYVGREQQGAGAPRLQVHVQDGTGAVPGSAELPATATAIPDGDLKRRDPGLF